MIKKLTLICCLVFSYAVHAQELSKHYKIYDVKKQQIVSLENVVADIKNVDVLFFGEEHNDSIGHYLEVSILKQFALQQNNKVALTMEMFHTDIQGVIDEYLAGLISEKNFIKEARAWNNYKDYKPMVEFAKANKIDVIGANGATRYSNVVTKSGITALSAFPASSKQLIAPLPIDTATGRYYEKFVETLGGHSMGAMKIYQTQNFWDATMAWSIAKYLKANKGKKVFQVNGRFHSDEGLGTLAKLKIYAPKLKIANISSFAAEDFENPNWANYTKLADYIMLTDPKVKKTF